ncbi:hypothetical protein ACFL5O_03600 [Myxococcota bacterium]
MLRSDRTGARSVSQAATDFGFSRPTYYEAQAAFEGSGMLGLLPARKGSRRAHKLSDAVMSFIDRQLEAEPTLTAAILAKRIRKHLSVTVHPRSISGALKRREKNNGSHHHRHPTRATLGTLRGLARTDVAGQNNYRQPTARGLAKR